MILSKGVQHSGLGQIYGKKTAHAQIQNMSRTCRHSTHCSIAWITLSLGSHMLWPPQLISSPQKTSQLPSSHQKLLKSPHTLDLRPPELGHKPPCQLSFYSAWTNSTFPKPYPPWHMLVPFPGVFFPSKGCLAHLSSCTKTQLEWHLLCEAFPDSLRESFSKISVLISSQSRPQADLKGCS